jgi:polyferredoxin
MTKLIDAVLVDEGSALFAAERKVYPRDIRGRHDTLRRIAVFLLLGLYYTLPWLSWDARQAILFDLPARKFFVFGLAFWPQDFIYLAMLLMIAGLALFFFTAVAGRLWCGYACPQTVWTETFLWMERLTEGDRAKRMKLDASGWTREKLLRKGIKHMMWIVFALWTGFTFVGFFTPIHDLASRAPLGWSGWEAFWVAFYSLATWGNAGFLREQVCKYMCPYARFQGAMFDKNTLIIAYDAMRGEPRGSRKRGGGSVQERGRALLSPDAADRWVTIANLRPSAAARQLEARGTTGAHEATSLLEPLAGNMPLPPQPTAEALGDCIDDTLCVQVCPTGIDIRNGLQYECIACGACVDACNSVMDRMGFPRGLIRHTTHNIVVGQPARILRPRVLIYGALLLALIVGWAWGVAHREPLIVEALRDRNALYRIDGETVENVYTLKLVNKQEIAHRYRIALVDAGPVTLPGTTLEVDAAPGEVINVPLTLQAPAGVVTGRRPLRLSVQSLQSPDVRATVETAFFGPM